VTSGWGSKSKGKGFSIARVFKIFREQVDLSWKVLFASGKGDGRGQGEEMNRGTGQRGRRLHTAMKVRGGADKLEGEKVSRKAGGGLHKG